MFNGEVLVKLALNLSVGWSLISGPGTVVFADPGTIGTVQDSPVAVDDSFSTGVDTPLTQGAAAGVLANDTDADGDSLSAVLVGGPSNGTLILNPDGLFTYTPNGGFTGADTFSYKVTDGTVDSNVATVAITVGSAWFSDSFEKTLPNGWKNEWAPAWDLETVVNTGDEGIPAAPGGGSQAFRQWWNGQNNRPTGGWSNAGGLVLDFGKVVGMPSKSGRLADGAAADEMTFSYYCYYDPNFDWGQTTGLKQIIARNDQSTQPNQLYIGMHYGAGTYNILFQHTSDTSFLHSNVNGPSFDMPKGEWVHFEWCIKVSPQVVPDGSGGWTPNPNIDGNIKGWVNGKLRWDYSDIATIERGNYVSMNLNPTFNPNPGRKPRPPDGPNQKRYWDQFSIGP